MRQYTKRQIRLWISTLEKRHKKGTQKFLQDIIGINQRYIRLIKEGKRPGYKWGSELKKAVETPTKHITLKSQWETGKVIKRTERGVEYFKEKMTEAVKKGEKVLAKKYKSKYKGKELQIEELEKGGWFDVEDLTTAKRRGVRKVETLDDIFTILEKKNRTHQVYIRYGKRKKFFDVGEFKKDEVYTDSAVVAITDVLETKKQTVEIEYGYKLKEVK